MTTMQLFLSPMDVWLFRDGRPFDAGSDHRARSLFPPNPSVMQGVIRSHHLIVKKVDLTNGKAIEEAVGTTNDYRGLGLRGPFLARWDGETLTRYYPVPTDTAIQGDKFVRLHFTMSSSDQVKTSASEKISKLLSSSVEPTKTSPGEWLTEENLRECLKGNPACAVRSRDLFERENRFGIGRDDTTRTTKETALYEAEFIRPCKDVGLYLEVEGYGGWDDSGVMRIGGEGRGALYQKITAGALQQPKKDLPAQFKVYFATPTYFKNGWLPESWNKFFDGEANLVAVALNRYESVGGYDWTKKGVEAQKPARRYVPAGSVYYFESNGSVKLKTETMTDRDSEIGYGQFFIQEV
jgi:CRISPR-associated protein Cmr3